MAAVVPASLAFACVGLMGITVNTSTVEPGGTVIVAGNSFAQDQPIEIRLDSPTGQVLATVPPPTSTMTSKFEMPVVIPPDVPRGQHLIVAVQNYHHMNAGAPARATIQVGTTAPVLAALPPTRPAGLAAETGPNGGALALIALTTAAVALLLAGLVSLLAARRSTGGEPTKA